MYCAQETLSRSSDTAHYICVHNAHAHQQRKHDVTIGYVWGLRNRFQSFPLFYDLRYNPGVQFKPVWTTKIATH